MSEQPKDPFFDGNEIIEEAIDQYFNDSTDANMYAVLDAIRERMHKDGHFIFPVLVDENDDKQFKFRTIQTADGETWLAAFTSKAEYEKGAPSNILSNYIDSTLKSSLEFNTPGFIINPWGQGFALSRKLIKKLFKADKGKEYSVPEEPLTPELLKDGSYLKKAVEICSRNHTQLNMLRLIRILHESYVWVPCNVVLSDKDFDDFKKVMGGEKASGNVKKVGGKTFITQEEMGLMPDILQNDGNYFFPVFAQADDMGDYGNNFSKVQKHFLEAVAMAQNTDKELAGMIINAFTDPVVIPAELFEIIMKEK